MTSCFPLDLDETKNQRAVRSKNVIFIYLYIIYILIYICIMYVIYVILLLFLLFSIEKPGDII